MPENLVRSTSARGWSDNSTGIAVKVEAEVLQLIRGRSRVLALHKAH